MSTESNLINGMSLFEASWCRGFVSISFLSFYFADPETGEMTGGSLIDIGYNDEDGWVVELFWKGLQNR